MVIISNSSKFRYFSPKQTMSKAYVKLHTIKIYLTQNNECFITSEHSFSVEEIINPFPDVENIPNLISPNGDGINDTWVIPTPYVSGSNTMVTIYSSQGKVVFSTNDYLNNWPENDLNLSSVNQVYYYLIVPQDQEPKKGSITVVK